MLPPLYYIISTLAPMPIRRILNEFSRNALSGIAILLYYNLFIY